MFSRQLEVFLLKFVTYIPKLLKLDLNLSFSSNYALPNKSVKFLTHGVVLLYLCVNMLFFYFQFVYYYFSLLL